LLLHHQPNPNPNPDAQMAKMVVKTTFHQWLKSLPNARKERPVINAIHLSLKSETKLT
jgi:hypothetical protein